MGPLRFIRIRPGLAPETQRVVHLTDFAGELAPWTFEDLPGTVVSTAGTLPVLCGQLLVPGTYDVLRRMAGMPCEPCLLKSPGSDPDLPVAVAVLPEAAAGLQVVIHG